MPAEQALERFVALVEAGSFLQAMDEFYAADATMQENEQPPRVGKAVLMAHEQKVMGGTAAVKARCVRPLLAQGDHVVVRWVFEFTDRQGAVRRIDELAWQRWRGDRIVEEKFFYDPSQMATVRTGSGGAGGTG